MALPTRLQPYWPLFKRLHRLLTLIAGTIFRRTSFLFGARGVPTRATSSSVETARREPGTVTVHPGGPAETIHRTAVAGTPSNHWVFAGGRDAEVPARYTLEIEGGRITGDFGATTTPRKRLDYQTSGYFGLSSWREHPVYLRPTLGTVEHVPGTVLSLTTRGAAANYYHFMYDAIARYGVFEESLPGTKVDAVIVPHATRYQKQLLELAGIEGPWLQPRANHTFTADRLLVPSTPNQALDAPRSAVSWLRKRLPATGNGDTPKRLYLSRGQKPLTRRYVEEAALMERLEKQGFTMIDPGTLTVQEQINAFAGAEFILAPHGAGLTNITFCSPGAKVMEMFAPSYVHLGLWNIAEAIDGVEYRYLVGEGNHPAGKPMLDVLQDVSIPPATVEAAVNAFLSEA
jgi:hypothetical protein